jgi:exodeoxyribonuclease VII small subunit
MAAFEESLTKLEGVVAKLESGELTLEDSVALYEEGVRLSATCKAELERAEGRVQVLTRGRGGKAAAIDFADHDESETENEEQEDEG